MKNISKILNIALLLAVLTLYYLHFTTGTSKEHEPVPKEGGMINGSKIVYINSDSLLTNYAYINDQQELLREKSEKLNNQYKNRAQKLQVEFEAYQNNGNNMTASQARAVEEDLMKKQQDLQVYEQNLTQQLVDDEEKINRELYSKVSTFLKRYAEENQIQIVVKYNPGSDVLYVNEEMNITELVLEQLNEEYNSVLLEADKAVVD